jgi:hypothetical protein
MDMRRAALLALLGVVLLAAAAGARPQPIPICGFCGDNFEHAADDSGVNATVDESSVVVQVHENGSATWTVRNRLTNGSDRFRDDPGRLDAVGRSLADGSRGVASDPRFVSARMDGDTAVLVYRDGDAAQRRAGLLVVDYLHDDGYERWYIVDADEFTIRGPAGTVVTNDPESGAVDGRSVTWGGNGGSNLYEAPDLGGSPYVVFGPDRSTGTRLRAVAALTLATLPIVVRSVRSFLLPQTALFAVLLGVVVTVVRRQVPDVGVGPLAGALAVLGGAGVVVPVVVGTPGWVGGPQLLGLGLGLLAWDERARGHLRSTRRLALAAAGVLVVAFIVLGAVGALVPARSSPIAALRVTTVALPLAVMLPLGGALGDPDGRPLAWGALTVAGFAAVPAAVLNFADPPSGFGTGITVLFLIVLAVAFPIVGAVVVTMGRSLAAPSSKAP